MKHLNHLLTLVIAFLKADEELMGLYLEDLAKKVAQPFVFVFVVGVITSEQMKLTLKRVERLIEPETPDFYLTK